MPMNDTDATARTSRAEAKFALAKAEVEEVGDGEEEERGADDTVHHCEDPHAEEVRRPGEGRHERVLDRPLPPLPRNGLGEDLEDDPEVRPDNRADQ